jgi:hypothetical protein
MRDECKGKHSTVYVMSLAIEIDGRTARTAAAWSRQNDLAAGSIPKHRHVFVNDPNQIYVGSLYPHTSDSAAQEI